MERKLKLEAEVSQLERTKRNWLTELEIITSDMEEMIKEQLKQQTEVMILVKKCCVVTPMCI